MRRKTEPAVVALCYGQPQLCIEYEVANLRRAVIPLIFELADMSPEQRHIAAVRSVHCVGVLDLTRCRG